MSVSSWACLRRDGLMGKYRLPEGWTLQGSSFVQDPTRGRAEAVQRRFCPRRFAYGWVVEQLKGDLDAYRKTGVSGEPP